MSKGKRRHDRYLIELPMTWSPLGGGSADDAARVRDLTPEGFGFETPLKVKQGQRLHFSIEVAPRERVSGQAVVVWVKTGEWGSVAGAHITRLGWGDRRTIMRLVRIPHYDWEAFFDRLLWTSSIVAAALVLEHVILHEKLLLRALWDVAPEMAAVIAMGGSVLWFLRHRRR